MLGGLNPRRRLKRYRSTTAVLWNRVRLTRLAQLIGTEKMTYDEAAATLTQEFGQNVTEGYVAYQVTKHGGKERFLRQFVSSTKESR